MKKMKILIPTCNKYIRYIEALQLSVFGSYLDSFDFVIIGDKKPEFELNKNWSFVSIGKDEPASKWSSRMIEFLSGFSDDHFIYGNDDCAITFINIGLLDSAISIMHKHKEVGRFALMAEGKKRPIIPFFTKRQAVEVSQFRFDADYLLSLGWSIYRKDFFLEFCKEEMTPWDYELQSCDEACKKRILPRSVLTFLPEQAIDGAFFARKNVGGVISEWHKGYYGHDLNGRMKDDVEKILFA
jgi:hypothetical protein